MKREKGLDFARALAALGILVYHFYCHSSSTRRLFYANANGDWGSLLCYLFFALSGYLLHLKYGAPGKIKLTTFYYKRWKATLPAYIAVFLFAYGMNVFSAGKFFYMPIPNWTLALSFIGLDGYLAWVTPTYYITGEWFLGAILIAYALYPLLRLLARAPWVKYLALAGLIALYRVVMPMAFGGIPLACNPVTCVVCFYVGMLGAETPHIIKHKLTFFIALAVSILLLAVPMGGENISKMMVAGIALLVTLYHIGNFLCKWKFLDRAVLAISAISYPIFLIHHRIILKVLAGFDTVSTRRSVGILLLCIVITLLLAKALDMVMKPLLKSALFTKLDRLFIKDGKE